MIPHIIHYCWFGGNDLPELATKCISSWKRYMPDYKIKEWNENNYDVRKIPYTAQAYDAHKYAFVSDFARIDILNSYGGIYFDVDVEVIKPLDDIVNRGPFVAIEIPGSINIGLGMASQPNSFILREILKTYLDSNFINSDGSYNLTTVVERVSKIFRRHGFTDVNELQKVENFTIYPSDWFCPKSLKTGVVTITKNTHTIHWYDASWTSLEQQNFYKRRSTLIKRYGTRYGYILSIPYMIVWQIKEVGTKETLKKCVKKIFHFE